MMTPTTNNSVKKTFVSHAVSSSDAVSVKDSKQNDTTRINVLKTTLLSLAEHPGKQNQLLANYDIHIIEIDSMMQ